MSHALLMFGAGACRCQMGRRWGSSLGAMFSRVCSQRLLGLGQSALLAAIWARL